MSPAGKNKRLFDVTATLKSLGVVAQLVFNFGGSGCGDGMDGRHLVNAGATYCIFPLYSAGTAGFAFDALPP